MSAKPTNGCKINGKSALELSEAKWTTLKRINWQDPTGRKRVWESAERVTHGDTTVDAVGIIALLRSPHAKTRIILEKQFRPPLNAICIEVPAGMMDKNESPEQTAERELHEETGYVGKARKGSYKFYNDPGFTNTSTFMVHVDIDLTDARNSSVEPKLEEGEFIEVVTPELDTLNETLRQYEAEGYAIDGRLAAFAEGFDLARSLSQ